MSTITGDAVFNSSNNNGTIEGESFFNGDSANTGIVVGEAYFSDNSENNGTVDGNAAFYDNAANTGEVTNAAAFLDEAQNNGDIGTLCDAAPAIIQHPENVYAGGGGPSVSNNAPMLFSMNAADFTSASFSIRAEENPWINVSWTIAATHGYNQVSTFFVSGSYQDAQDLNIGNIGGLPGEVHAATINCKLDNPIGEVFANPAIFKKGDNPSITQEAIGGEITVNEGDDLIFPFAAFSWADTVTVGISNGNMIVDPVVVEGEFNTEIDNDSLNLRRKITLGYLNLGRPATLEDNNAQWWFRISDMFGVTMAPNEIRTYVTPTQ